MNAVATGFSKYRYVTQERTSSTIAHRAFYSIHTSSSRTKHAMRVYFYYPDWQLDKLKKEINVAYTVDIVFSVSSSSTKWLKTCKCMQQIIFLILFFLHACVITKVIEKFSCLFLQSITKWTNEKRTMQHNTSEGYHGYYRLVNVYYRLWKSSIDRNDQILQRINTHYGMLIIYNILCVLVIYFLWLCWEYTHGNFYLPV